MSPDTQQSDELTDCIAQVKSFALQEFDRQIQSHQLYYHTHDHIAQVQRRSQLIFDAIRSDLSRDEIAQIDRLLDLCVVAHDMIQIFQAQSHPHTTRTRSSGVSETATLDQLIDYIDSICPGTFTDIDRTIIRAAISATICAYDPQQQAIYQPALDNSDLPIVARILALADLGALGIDGVEMYNREGSLLFLEENLDVVPLLITGKIEQLEIKNPSLAENIRQRLLKRSRFQVNFAKSRLARFDHEVRGFPGNAIDKLRHEVFRYLRAETIQEIENRTPISDRASLKALLEFFNFGQYLAT
jgi:hypothetical protein